jgi:hypothetical protein
MAAACHVLVEHAETPQQIKICRCGSVYIVALASIWDKISNVKLLAGFSGNQLPRSTCDVEYSSGKTS